jgi:hypothetical protein
MRPHPEGGANELLFQGPGGPPGVRAAEDRRFLPNTYRVLLTRAWEGLMVWVPRGKPSDRTRQPEELDAAADFLAAAGAQPLGGESALDQSVQ